MPKGGSRGPRRWTDGRLRSELSAYLADRKRLTGKSDWPTAVEMETTGYHALRSAIRDHGGATYWANQLGIELSSGQDRGLYETPDAVADMQKLLDRLGVIPGAIRIRRLGYSRLASLLGRYPGGALGFCRDHHLGQGLSLATRRPLSGD